MKLSGLYILLIALLLAQCSKKEPDLGALEELSAGQAAKALLSEEKYKSLTVEVVYTDGYPPSQPALDQMRSFLLMRLNKPEGIEIITKKKPSTGTAVFSLEKLKEIEADTRTEERKNEHMTIYIYYADGGYIEDGNNLKKLGVAYKATSVVIFKRSLDDYFKNFDAAYLEKVEGIVLQHEMAHLLGLVDNGTPMQSGHKHKGHCSTDKCLMHHYAETTDVLFLFSGNIPPKLDQLCLNDLKANGGK